MLLLLLFAYYDIAADIAMLERLCFTLLIRAMPCLRYAMLLSDKPPA